MSIAEPTAASMTAEALMRLPDDGVHRELIRGELRESPMTVRNRKHSRLEIVIGWALEQWLRGRPAPRGKVHGGEAGFRLSREPETLVGIDVAFASAELVARTDPGARFYDGPPVLAVEILSPSDEQEKVVEKVRLYLDAGSVVWVVDPDFRTVAVHRPGRPVIVFNEQQELDGEDYLPGFRVAVAALFE
jgi:Uma2 family endonuclease